MNIKTRRTLFFASLLIFLTASPIIIMYSLGYKLDTKTLKLQKTGGIFIDLDYNQYKITLNGKIKKEVNKTLFTQRGALIPNLMPRNYKVIIEKEGYIPWGKILKVKSGLVTEIKNAILIKKDLKPIEIDEDVIDLITSETEKNIGYITKNSIIIFDVKNQKKKSIKISEDNKLKLIGFSSDENDIFLENNTKIFKTDFKENKLINLKKPKTEKYLKILPSQKDKDTLYALSDKSILYEINFKKEVKIKEILQKINNFYATKDDLVYLTQEPANFYKKNIESEKITQITFNPVKDTNINSEIITRFGDPIAIIDKNKNLLLFDYASEKFKKLAEGVLDAKISKDSSKLLYRKEREIYVYYLEKSYPGKKSGEIDLLGRFGSKIKEASWFSYNNHHIFFNIEDNLKIIELDGRDKRNSYNIIKGIIKYSYNNIDKSVYTIKNNKLEKITIIEEK